MSDERDLISGDRLDSSLDFVRSTCAVHLLFQTLFRLRSRRWSPDDVFVGESRVDVSAWWAEGFSVSVLQLSHVSLSAVLLVIFTHSLVFIKWAAVYFTANCLDIMFIMKMDVMTSIKSTFDIRSHVVLGLAPHSITGADFMQITLRKYCTFAEEKWWV